MSFWKDLDPTGDNFLGLGPTLGRILAGVGTLGGTEFHRTNGFGTKPGTWENDLNRGLGGAGPGAVGGFVTGGIPGAIIGGVGGGVAAGTGKTNSTTLSGFGENLGLGVGGGGLYSGGSALLDSLGTSGTGSAAASSGSSSAAPFSFSKLMAIPFRGSSGGNSMARPNYQGASPYDDLLRSLQQKQMRDEAIAENNIGSYTTPSAGYF